MLPLKAGEEIEYLEYLPADLVPELPVLKYSIVDVRCVDKKGRQFIVEMQMIWTESFKSRMVFNASKAYVKQLGDAKKYKALQPVYALSLVNEIFNKKTTEFYHHYQIVNLQDTKEQLEGLEFVFVELKKFKAQNFAEKKMQVLWLRFLTEINEEMQSVPAELLESEIIQKALEQIQISAFTKSELESYDKYWDNIRSEITLIDDAHEKGKEEAQKELLPKLEEAEKQKEEAEKQKEEAQQKLVQLMLQFGKSMEQIEEETKLSKAEIEKIIQASAAKK
jgi:predicted transposase/invertase (TIGR01784 family)